MGPQAQSGEGRDANRTAEALERLSRIGALIASEHDPGRVIQRVTDEATALVGAEFGAFFYNVTNASGESYMLYTLSGASREDFASFPMPRNTEIFAPTFAGEGITRCADVAQDPRYGKNGPYYGMPKGHLPVRSYLAAPVRSVGGEEVLGGLFFGHAQPGVFDDSDEQALGALAPIAGAALTNARLFAELAAQQKQLLRGERRYRLVTEATEEGVWFWDIPSNRVEWNDRLFLLMGLSRSDWSGQFDDWFTRVHPDDQPGMRAALAAHLEKRTPYRIDLFRLRHADGTYRYCSTRGQAEWDDEGCPVHMAGSFRDVTEEKLVSDRLREEEHRFSQILDSVQDMIFTRDENSNLTWANAAGCEYLGKTRDELPATIESIVDGPEVATRYSADDRAIIEDETPRESVHQALSAPGGEMLFLHTVKSPLRDTQGKVVGVVGVTRDITRRSRDHDMQELLAEASAILGTSIDYETTFKNLARATVPRFADWTAVDLLVEGELERLEVCHPDPQKVALAHELHRKYPPDMDAPHGVPNVLRTGQPECVADIPDELLVRAAKDTEHLRIARELGLRSYICAPILVRGEVTGAISFVSAESRRRYGPGDVKFATELARRAGIAIENAKLYEQVRELAATLEQRVEERTAELVQANEELESFSYTVSHDLRAPVRHITGFVDLLRAHAGDHLDEKAQHYLETIRNAAVRMGVLTDALLSFSRLGRTELRKRPVPLQQLVGEVQEDLELDTKSRQIHWTVDTLPTVLADATLMRSVLSNLLSNAVKYTRHRTEAHIEVSATVSEGEIIVQVRDNGVGFNMDYAHKLFGVFRRLHSDAEFEGTGIGLATVKRAVERHGGRVWAEGKLNEGATFSFSLPRKEHTEGDAPASGSPSSQAGTTRAWAESGDIAQEDTQKEPIHD